MAMRVHTIGHSTRTLDELLRVLAAHGIRELIDVRAWPTSKRHPHFDRASLEEALPACGIRYTWMGKALGGYRKRIRDDSPHTALRTEMFRNYADHMESAVFGAALDDVLARAADHAVALMCAERHWSRCHRSFVADHLTGVRGAEVVHLLDEATSEPHRLHATARVEPGRIVYDRSDEPRLPGF